MRIFEKSCFFMRAISPTIIYLQFYISEPASFSLNPECVLIFRSSHYFRIRWCSVLLEIIYSKGQDCTRLWIPGSWARGGGASQKSINHRCQICWRSRLHFTCELLLRQTLGFVYYCVFFYFFFKMVQLHLSIYLFLYLFLIFGCTPQYVGP